MDVTDIIDDAFGGYSALAADLRVGRTVVFNWYKIGIPPTRWKDLWCLAQVRGLNHITLELLMLSQPRTHDDPSHKVTHRRDKTAHRPDVVINNEQASTRRMRKNVKAIGNEGVERQR